MKNPYSLILPLLLTFAVHNSIAQTTLAWTGFTTQTSTSSYTWTPNASRSVTYTASGGSSRSATVINNGAVTSCSNQTGLLLTMSGAGNSVGTGAWNNSITITMNFPSYVCGPVTFSIYDINEDVYNDGSATYAYFQDKVTISALNTANVAVTPTVTLNGSIGNTTSGSSRVLTANLNNGQCKAQNISIGSSGTNIKSITIVYANQDPPTNVTGSPTRYGISQSQYIVISPVTVQCITTLPVELTSFQAERENDDVLVKWSTASESNCQKFVIERSRDLENWSYVSEQPGAGQSNHTINYNFRDRQPLPGVSYYRLVQTDFNGESEIFGPVSVDVESVNRISVFPNPSDGQFTVEIPGMESNEELELQVADMTGKIISKRSVSLAEGTNQFMIDGSLMEKGIYLVRLVNADAKLKFDPVRLAIE